MGGAASVLGPAPLAVDAQVLESVYPSIEDAVADRLQMRLGLPGRWLAPLLYWQLPLRLGVSPSALRPIEAIARVRCPLLVMAGSTDQHTTMAEAQRPYAAAPQPKSLWVVEGAAHQDLYHYAPDDYRAPVLALLASLPPP
ncbi:hypothetical protein SAMN02745857_00631 [Andreprevotia lacus DSM 23236]|jgi:fermentation-respiration switch protein FrsA (DUF1100 family)|uniref:Alpha/beta hydrolase family protein n=2 Tax=Andreprevotia TaxID=397275 RepID=A0A1W1X587_9NEIS|nr:hypothetical protein SAMN02745857_00631 [Andreprevotia lacus DSM 23236]